MAPKIGSGKVIFLGVFSIKSQRLMIGVIVGPTTVMEHGFRTEWRGTQRLIYIVLVLCFPLPIIHLQHMITVYVI
jgi:hypothetical protein